MGLCQAVASAVPSDCTRLLEHERLRGPPAAASSACAPKLRSQYQPRHPGACCAASAGTGTASIHNISANSRHAWVGKENAGAGALYASIHHRMPPSKTKKATFITFPRTAILEDQVAQIASVERVQGAFVLSRLSVLSTKCTKFKKTV